MKLTNEVFYEVIKHTPLISIDLILSDPFGKILLGRRTNSPAINTWFVPGGRIMKDETITNAFLRITYVELGNAINIEQADFLGIYEHIYPNENYFNDKEFSTHYIVLGFKIMLKENIDHLPNDQHKEYKWACVNEILNDEKVHQNTKNYFNGTLSLK